MGGLDTANEAGGVSDQRLDKWLWFARVTKSRTLAATLVLEGKIRVNGERVAKPAHTLKAGDAVTIAMRQRVRILRVKGFGLRRGSAALASELFDDLSPPPVKANAVGGDATDAGFRGGADAQRVPGSGRPTKRERRELDRFKSRADE
jgi:ribosome-associated heat shock protein Hsp15